MPTPTHIEFVYKAILWGERNLVGEEDGKPVVISTERLHETHYFSHRDPRQLLAEVSEQAARLDK